MTLPPPYTPTCLRREAASAPRQRLYGIGLRKDSASADIGMMWGPTASLKSCLEQPGQEGAVIVRFNVDHTDDIAWEWRDYAWHPMPGVKHDDAPTA